MTARWWRLGALGVLVADGLALFAFAPPLTTLGTGLSAPHTWVDRAGADGVLTVVAGSLLWLAGLWLAIGLLATLATAATGRNQGWIAWLSYRATPAVIRRLVVASASATLTLTPVSAVAGTPAGPIPMIGSASATSAEAFPLSMPTQSTSPAATAPGPVQAEGRISRTPTDGTASTGPAGWPLDGVDSAAPQSPPAPGSTPEPSGPTGGAAPKTVTPLPPVDATPDPSDGQTVLVRPGDSLWLIAAQRLGPDSSDADVAVAWPYWYRANRAMIGTDPDLVHPGQRLAVPIGTEGS